MRATALRLGYERLARPLLFSMGGGDPERVHEAMLGLLARLGTPGGQALLRLVGGGAGYPVRVAGVDFPGRVGVAAGLDKDGVAARAWAQLGFGFMELGTVTAQAQSGNPVPRLYRLPASRALINRMGFNNAGAAALAERLAGWGVRRGQPVLGAPVGISLGKTKVVDPDATIADYCAALTAVHRQADYVALNISSPNTPGLRDWQGGRAAGELVAAVVAQARSLEADPVPVFVKVAPDLAEPALDELIEAVLSAGAAGLIATNTTVSRPGVLGADRRYARQAGGLSGAPLTGLARQVVARCVASGRPVMASGGLMTVADAQAMFDLGAVAVQLYTGFIYAGTSLVAGINALAPQEGS
jgi:dihydroorotate dehydrogenase